MSSPSSIKRPNVQGRGCDAVAGFFLFFGEKGSGFSLGFRPIGSSVFDGARRKVSLRGEDYAWAPIWWSSDNSKR